MDVPTIPERYVVRDPAMDICSDNSHRDGADTGHGHMIEMLVFATVFTLIVLLTGGPTNGA